jgi:hypothetical protein
MIDLAEIDRVAALHPLASATHPSPVRFRRADYLSDPSIPLDAEVRDLVAARTGHRPTGPVSLLANVRTWGWLFNPISLYFCSDDAPGSGVSALVAEVQNTPWHERTAYVVGGPGEHRFAKALHVSPFLPMDVDYVLRYSAPGPTLAVSLDVLDGATRLFSARMTLRRRPLDRAALGRLVWAKPAFTHRVTAGIYTQAALLRLKDAPFHVHPSKRTAADVTVPPAAREPAAR